MANKQLNINKMPGIQRSRGSGAIGGDGMKPTVTVSEIGDIYYSSAFANYAVWPVRCNIHSIKPDYPLLVIM